MAKLNPEFAIHVHKQTATAEHQDLYTIGVWNGPTLHAICHVQPLDRALRALRNVLDQAGKPQMSLSAQPSDATQRRGFRKLAAAILASIAGFIKSVP